MPTMPAGTRLLDSVRAHWPLKLGLSAAVSIVFWTAYLLAQRFPLGTPGPAPSLPVDATIPFVPSTVYLYESLWLLQAVAPWLMRERRALILYCRDLLTILIPALVVFILWPTASPRPPCPEAAPALYRALIRVDLDLNAFPSLHAAFAVYSALGCRFVVEGIRRRAAVMGVVWIWTAGILAATLLTKQHTVPDLLAGALLGWAGHAVHVLSRRRAGLSDSGGVSRTLASRGRETWADLPALPPKSPVPGELALFAAYPRLKARLPHVALGRFPTPVQKLDKVGHELGLETLYIKRDDLSGDLYGGNKVRKLEFLLGEALRAKAGSVVTFGFAGSNHALATAIYARQVGLPSTSMLMAQPNAHYVRRNLLAGHRFSAELRHYRGLASLLADILPVLVRGRWRDGAFPRFIPAGGSCPLGVTGYVNAALELKHQIASGAVPPPDIIYVPMGSMGTSAGLALGLKVAEIGCRVIALRVIEENVANAAKAFRLARRTATFLHGLDPAFPDIALAPSDLTVRGDCLGDGYARFTEKGLRAAELMHRQAGIILNGAYSAKAFAALLDDAAGGALNGKTVLFWNTYNSRALTPFTADIDYRALPSAFHRYFENDVQPLDRTGPDRMDQGQAN